MSDSLANRTALVCGSSRGIGRACAEALAAAGATITLVARDEAALAEVAAALPGDGHRTLAGDFADPGALAAKVDAHLAAHGPVHVLVNNTGGPPAGPIFEATSEAFLDAMTRHLLCNHVLVRAVVPGMRAAGFGRIINIISTSVITPIKGLGVSNTTRGAVANWARTLAGELAPDGITVNNVLPGFTATQRLAQLFEGKAKRLNMTPGDVEAQAIATIPAARLGRPEEIGAVVAFLASPTASYVNGVNLPVDGGRLAVQ